MSEEKIGMYSIEEIYEELATGFLHHSMVDAMYFKIKDLQQKAEQLENIRKEAIKYVQDWQSFPHTNCTTHNELKNLLNILNKGENNE